jgi:hypothetical protein
MSVFAKDKSLEANDRHEHDIPERRRAQEQQTLLVRKMSDRAENLVAVAGSISPTCRSPAPASSSLRHSLRIVVWSQPGRGGDTGRSSRSVTHTA